MTIGKLSLVGKKKSLQVTFTNKKGNSVSMQATDLSASLANIKATKIDELDGLEVELDEVQGQPKRIRKPGENWKMPAPRVDSSQTTQRSNQQQERRGTLPQQGDFHNPYNFIPALPRLINHPDLGDHHPIGHGTYQADRWSGRIAVKLTTVTPLLIPDAAKAIGDEHKTYPLRVDAAGKPYLPPTSIKGMLRSAYEAVTNSRLSVFEKDHENRLAYRMPTNMGLGMVPARIEKNADGQKVIRLFPGTSNISSDGRPEPNLMYAAWLPRYFRGNISRDAVQYPDGTLPAHKEEVEAWLERFQHSRWDSRSNRHQKDFQYWRVREIVPSGQSLGSQPRETPSRDKRERSPHHESLGEFRKAHGFVCITKPNIDRKHDERVFFGSSDEDIVSLSAQEKEALEKQWINLITDYQEIHKDEICKQRKTSPPVLKNSVWSRHIKGNGFTLATDERELQAGTLCYARVEKINDKCKVLGLYPVTIARELFSLDPQSLLPKELRPATKIEDLSPTDRVFGWIRQKEGGGSQGAYKGNLRVHSIQCPDIPKDELIGKFGNEGFPLNILGQPKPQQAKFYVAKDQTGQSLLQNTEKKDSYIHGQALRGRKVYPHHANLPSQHWNNPLEDRTQINQDGYFQEYRRSGDQRDDQNRSIQAWVKPNITFSFDVDVTNLSNFELGALLWLLALPPDHYHRLGGGKPFGFGSVRLDIDWDNTDLRKGDDWQQYYQSLAPLSNANSKESEATIALFQKAFEEAYGDGKGFNDIPLIQAFCRSAQGFYDKLPIHYPRARQQGQTGAVPPHLEGKAFEWFVANERTGGPKAALPPLWDETGLPILNNR
jgi:CRISPR-associated protein (TIGR03986 family)